MKGILYYDSKYGTTETVAKWIIDEIRAAQVDSIKIENSMKVSGKEDFIILGTPIYIGKPRQCFIDFISENKKRFPQYLYLFIVTWAGSTVYKEKTEGFLELIRYYLEPVKTAGEASLPGKLYLDKVSERDRSSMMRILHRLDLLSVEFESKNMTFTDNMSEADSRAFGRKINECLKNRNTVFRKG